MQNNRNTFFGMHWRFLGIQEPWKAQYVFFSSHFIFFDTHLLDFSSFWISAAPTKKSKKGSTDWRDKKNFASQYRQHCMDNFQPQEYCMKSRLLMACRNLRASTRNLQKSSSIDKVFACHFIFFRPRLCFSFFSGCSHTFIWAINKSIPSRQSSAIKKFYNHTHSDRMTYQNNGLKKMNSIRVSALPEDIRETAAKLDLDRDGALGAEGLGVALMYGILSYNGDVLFSPQTPPFDLGRGFSLDWCQTTTL